MLSDELSIRYLGGPTFLLEIGGKRFLTDPTFDPKNTSYPTNIYTLQKLESPRINSEALGKIDYVLLSHDHHFDNLDHEGRKLLSTANTVYTTIAGAERLGGNAIGLKNWEMVQITTASGKKLNITGTPCRHGPVGGDRGPVTGFVLAWEGENDGLVYISGDTVWYEGVEEVGHRFHIGLAILFMGAARVKEVGPDHLTMTAGEGVKAAKLFKDAVIVPAHFEGWKHFSESKDEIEAAFAGAGLSGRLRWAQ